MNPETKSYLHSPAGETWESALARFNQLSHLNLDEYTDEESGETVIINLGHLYDDGTLFEAIKESAANIRLYEANYGITVPPGLVKLMCVHGAFAIYAVIIEDERRWGERTFLEIYTPYDAYSIPSIKPLCEAIAFNFGNYFTKSTLTEQEIHILNTHYFCFGNISYNDENKGYLYFDKNNNFGSFKYSDDDFPETKEALTPLLAKTTTPFSLDALLASCVDQAIQLLLEYNEIDVAS